MRIAGLAILGALCVSAPALADVCQLNSKPVADKAVALLAGATKLIVYCGNCNSHAAFTIPIQKAQAVATDDPSYFEVNIDGGGVDLAYLYYLPTPRAPRWINLGYSAGCADMQTIGTVELPPMVSDTAGPPPPRKP